MELKIRNGNYFEFYLEWKLGVIFAQVDMTFLSPDEIDLYMNVLLRDQVMI